MITEQMYDKVIVRAEKHYPELVENFPSIMFIQQPAWIGTQSWTLVESKVRLIRDKNHVDFFPIPQTPSEFARDYLSIKFGEKRLRAFANQASLIKVHRAAPLMAIPQILDNHVYVDLKSAYWNITALSGWDVDYYPGRWIKQGAEMDDFPIPEHKLARNCLPTVGRHTTTAFWTGEVYKNVGGRNPLINFGLWAFVQDVLHAVAWDMVDIGAVYVHTDGYIIPMKNLQRALEITDEWGLKGSVRFQGHGKVFGIGSYDLGTHRAADALRTWHNPISKLNDVDRPMLKRYMKMYNNLRRVNFG